ncbi:MAG: 16S rRNA pseudouridine synthase [Parcubacteria group bacterium Gr01-1014_46]|nr:MAG: 16S rRNA pseudouridine synthase [Parcubacteria group bacterium Gr01-1014_46]
MKSRPKKTVKQKRVNPISTLDVYPMRINKYLAHKGVATRTGVDDLIKSSKVLINGVVAKLGDKVSESDKVEVRGIHSKKTYVYLAYNKPKGTVSTNPQRDEKDIMQSLKSLPKSDFGKGIFPVGRIDKESHGLMILTNDGRITDRLLNPIYNHEKEYAVKVDRAFTPGFLRNMQDGVNLEDGVTKPAIVKKIKEDTFSITLTEGRNRQIRRMTEKLGYTVRDLERIRIQNIKLEKTPENSAREITGNEKIEFLKGIGLE